MMATLRLLSSLALAVSLVACAAPEFRVMEADKCPVPADQLAAQCALPQSLQAGATYDDLVTLAVQDSISLRECSEQARFLRKAIEACNASIDQHNERIREINAKARAR
jgi:hypothetical protein